MVQQDKALWGYSTWDVKWIASCWALWRERNQRVFQGKSRYGNAGTGNCG